MSFLLSVSIYRSSVTVTEAFVLCPPSRKMRAHHRVSPYPGVRKRNQTETFSVHDDISSLMAATSALSARVNTAAAWYWLHPAVDDDGAKTRRVHGTGAFRGS